MRRFPSASKAMPIDRRYTAFMRDLPAHANRARQGSGSRGCKGAVDNAIRTIRGRAALVVAGCHGAFNPFLAGPLGRVGLGRVTIPWPASVGAGARGRRRDFGGRAAAAPLCDGRDRRGDLRCDAPSPDGHRARWLITLRGVLRAGPNPVTLPMAKAKG